LSAAFVAADLGPSVGRPEHDLNWTMVVRPRVVRLVTGSTFKLIGLILPLGLDTLGVALALGIAGVAPRGRLQLSFLFAGFEAVMPLVGLFLGAPLGDAIGGTADYAAAGLIAALGVRTLFFERDGDDESERVLSLTQSGLLGVLALGFSISLDELAVGFTAGLLRLPILAMAVAIGLQAFIVTQIGVRVGGRVGGSWHVVVEKVAGAALIALAAILLLERLTA
jgi:putative Mn2+ efflux pump MntP